MRDISPIQINRDRRQRASSEVTDDEQQQLRGLVGSLQYAACNTRPDLAAELSFYQSRATVQDLLEANRLPERAKKHALTRIIIKHIPVHQLRFATYSDASFATRTKAQSQRGCMILAVHEDMQRNQPAPASPISWCCKKITRVLAAETFALSGAVGWLDWIRMNWAWLARPKVEWKQPNQTLPKLPIASAVIDCKSLSDLVSKNATPQCQEYRTLLEALVIKDRINTGIKINWVPSAAQLADSLTKNMDTSFLLTFLKTGRCCIHDETEVLKARADKKTRQLWLKQSEPNAQSLETPEAYFCLI